MGRILAGNLRRFMIPAPFQNSRPARAGRTGIPQPPVPPVFRVVLLEKSVAGEGSAAAAIVALVIDQYVESAAAKNRDVLDHPHAGVRKAVQQDDRLFAAWLRQPGAGEVVSVRRLNY